MKTIYLLLVISFITQFSYCQDISQNKKSQTEINKEIARGFYQDLWFTNNTQNYSKYVAKNYVVHDIGDRKGVTEPAIEQKNIADFFWKHGELGGKINYQVAEGDLVVTHWTTTIDSPKTLFGRLILTRTKPFYIINVLRIKDGKIIEFWNHRHDIDTPQTLRFTFKGLTIGLLIALIPTALAFRLRRKIKNLT